MTVPGTRATARVGLRAALGLVLAFVVMLCGFGDGSSGDHGTSGGRGPLAASAGFVAPASDTRAAHDDDSTRTSCPKKTSGEQSGSSTTGVPRAADGHGPSGAPAAAWLIEDPLYAPPSGTELTSGMARCGPAPPPSLEALSVLRI